MKKFIICALAVAAMLVATSESKAQIRLFPQDTNVTVNNGNVSVDRSRGRGFLGFGLIGPERTRVQVNNNAAAFQVRQRALVQVQQQHAYVQQVQVHQVHQVQQVRVQQIQAHYAPQQIIVRPQPIIVAPQYAAPQAIVLPQTDCPQAVQPQAGYLTQPAPIILRQQQQHGNCP